MNVQAVFFSKLYSSKHKAINLKKCSSRESEKLIQLSHPVTPPRTQGTTGLKEKKIWKGNGGHSWERWHRGEGLPSSALIVGEGTKETLPGML